MNERHSRNNQGVVDNRETRATLASMGLKLASWYRRCGECGTRNLIVSARDGYTCMGCELRARKKAKRTA